MFKANLGLEGLAQTPRSSSFCAWAIDADGPFFEVPDARTDKRFADNPLVTGAPRIRHYAGAPVTLSDGLRIGTVCVISPSPGRLLPAQADNLTQLASITSALLEARLRKLSRAKMLHGHAGGNPSGRLEELLEVARSRSRLLAGIAHAMANRLHVILGLDQLIRSDPKRAHDHDPWFESVEEAGAQLLQGLSRVLALSHLGVTSGTGDQPPAKPQLVVEVDDALSRLQYDHPGAVVLLVDDDPGGRAVDAGLLEHAGLTVVTAPNGKDAARLAQHMSPALILMDLHMPVMDGLEAARAIRAQSRHQQNTDHRLHQRQSGAGSAIMRARRHR